MLRWLQCSFSPVAAQKGNTKSPAATRHTQQVVSNSVDTLSDQLKPHAAAAGGGGGGSGDGGGVLLIPCREPPHVGSAFCSSNQDTYYQLFPENPFLDTQTLGQTRRYFSI